LGRFQPEAEAEHQRLGQAGTSRNSRLGAFYTRDQNAARTHLVL
jgi:hypothetical protein